MKKAGLILFLFILSLIGLCSATANDTMIVEANILKNIDPTPDVGIEVPDYVFLGNITSDSLISDEIKVYINNTGKTNITITPQLKDNSDTYFSYLFFRTRQQSSNEELNIFHRIGDYSLIIQKPSSDKRSEYFYMCLNLTSFSNQIDHDLLGYRSEIIFFAMPQ